MFYLSVWTECSVPPHPPTFPVVSGVIQTPFSPARDQDSPYEIMQLDFEMENFTSQSVTRRIMWHIDYRGRNPPPDLEKAVTELTVIQRDISAILALAMVSFYLRSKLEDSLVLCLAIILYLKYAFRCLI